MLRTSCRPGGLALLIAGLAFVAAPAHATSFLGLEVGDVIDSVDFNIPAGGAVFTDASDEFDMNAKATAITTTTPEVLLEISGGDVDILLDVESESLTHVFSTFFSYTATFSGRTGVSDVSIFSPTGGPAPEQDGRLLIEGELNGPTPTLTVFFDSTFATVPTFTMTGTFAVTGGDPTFRQPFGEIGSLADIFATSSASIPALNVLLADGYLFSVRNTNLLAVCAGGGNCTGTVLNQSGSWTAGGAGDISPQSPSAFVPEPSTAFLLGSGLVGLLALTRRSRAGGRTPWGS